MSESVNPICDLGPFPPETPARLRGRTRFYVEIEANDNGLAFRDIDPTTGEVIETGFLEEAA